MFIAKPIRNKFPGQEMGDQCFLDDSPELGLPALSWFTAIILGCCDFKATVTDSSIGKPYIQSLYILH